MKTFSWEDASKSQWDENAEFWHSNSKGMWDHGSRQDIIPFFKEHIPKGKIVDLGCGDGYGSSLLNKTGYQVVGLDISEKMIDIAKKQENEDLIFLQGNIMELPFKNEEFTGVLAINSLEWTENPLAALNEIFRVVQKDGYGCFGILGPTAKPRINSFPRLEGENIICNTMMPWEFLKLATENGWKKIAEKGVYKRGVTENHLKGLSKDLTQALTFMTLFVLRKDG
ncbi:methyltransferase domain-containing protein [Heyndrickxia sp. NPDC080065]|uniref:class I SAM-dependent methyltransferase n=1 Tax=Heyndrickxia sp. NPDC080065 TaxID=3390568 RepID=UPI003CFF7CB8